MKISFKQALITISIFIVGLLISLAIGDFIYWKGRYPPNCYFENINVSGMKRYEAHKKLKIAKVNEATFGYIKLDIEGKVLKFLPSEIGININAKKSIGRTSGTAYQHNFLKELYRKYFSDSNPTILPLALKIDKDHFKAVLNSIAEKTDVSSKDAGVVILGKGKGKIIEEIIGKKVNIQSSLINMEKVLKYDLRASTIEVETLLPRVYAKDLEEHPPVNILSRFTTYYGVHNSKNRIHNIQYAASKVNNYMLLSGETYSLLKVVGDISAAGGFKKAYVVKGDILDPQYGGGVCQVSTTVYNAAILAGLDILERHNHSLYFNIYPLGRDASIYNWNKDLKFTNNTGNPILIKAIASDTSVTVTTYGTPVPGKKVRFTSPTVYIKGEKPPIDSPKQSNERIREIMVQKKPFVSSVKMITYQDNRIIKTEEIKSNYRFAAFKYNVDVTAPEPE